MLRRGLLPVTAITLCLTLSCGGVRSGRVPAGTGTPQGAPQPVADAPVSSAPQPVSGAPASPEEADAGTGSPGSVAASAPGERPFAKSAAEASELITKAVESCEGLLQKCVDEARSRRKEPHAKIVLEMGIDQEGGLIGVKTPQGTATDEELLACAREALRGAPFPRSNAGVITLKKTFEDVWVYPQ